jgi:hypothetical protein
MIHDLSFGQLAELVEDDVIDLSTRNRPSEARDLGR